MKNKNISSQVKEPINHQESYNILQNTLNTEIAALQVKQRSFPELTNELAEILVVTSYPPRECGIATYSQDLIKTLKNKFSNSLSFKVCALESGEANYQYPAEVKYILNTSLAEEYELIALTINKDNQIKIVLIQHEFGFFRERETSLLQFLKTLDKPIIIVFHTVLPHPDDQLKSKILKIASACQSVIVMTRTSADILTNEYGVPGQKIAIIAHGTHLVPHLKEDNLKMKYGLKGKNILTTFGLLSSGKSIETTLEALPLIIKTNPDVVFLVIGKTHPEVVKSEGEKYRQMLEMKVEQSALQDHVIFINRYLELSELLEYLQLTDIYLFTTNDPNQAVSGTFAYAMSCGCPIISTPIPHAKEILTPDTGIIFDFRNAKQLADAILLLLNNDELRMRIGSNSLQKIVSTAWENSAVSHALLFSKIAKDKVILKYNLPEISLEHLKRMTTASGIIQFSKVNQPDIDSGYTLDDNARALVATCMYYKLTGFEETINDIHKYLSFINRCQQPNGDFLNYVDKHNKFTAQNQEVNLEDSNGRAIWALGFLVSLIDILPAEIISEARSIIEKSLARITRMHSTRAMAFAIKGLYYSHRATKSESTLELVKTLADRLVGMYNHEANINWEWFESYLTYANSVLPESLLYAWLMTGETLYKDIARSSFGFLLSRTFNKNGIEVISNKNWLKKGEKADHFGEQPIDVAYTVMTLSKFYDVFADNDYRLKMETAFNWFLGSNRLSQIVYNPCTGGCYDGLEEKHVNLNQGAESTVSYLMARLTMENYRNIDTTPKVQLRKHINMHSNQAKFIYSTNTDKHPAQPFYIALPLRLE